MEDQEHELQPQQQTETISLPLPLGINNLFALKKGGFILFGTATFASGTVTITDSRIRGGSKAFLSYDVAAKALSSSGTLSGACTDGQLVIKSTSGSDASDVAYLIIL